MIILVVQSLSRIQLFETPWTAAYQVSLSFTISQSFLKLMSIELVMPSNHLVLCRPLSSCLQSFPASESFLMSGLLGWGGQSIAASASVLQMIFTIDFLYDWLVWSPCSPRDSQESSPIPQFKSIISLAFCFLYGPTHIHTWLLEKP